MIVALKFELTILLHVFCFYVTECFVKYLSGQVIFLTGVDNSFLIEDTSLIF